MTFTIKLETKLRHFLFKRIVYFQKSPKILGVNKPRSAKNSEKSMLATDLEFLNYPIMMILQVESTPPLILLSIKNL